MPLSTPAAKNHKLLAVLFADISGSTQLYNTLGNEEAGEVVNNCLALILDVLPRFEGRFIKTIGDEVMSVFPTADQAVLAAIEMQNAVTDNPPKGHPVRIHIGLHFGPVVDTGSDVYGDTVNTAAYLGAVAASEQVLITDATEAVLSELLKARVRPIFNTILKGSTNESTIFQILWRKFDPNITGVNLQLHRIIPSDTGQLAISYRGQTINLDQKRSCVMIGRSASSDIVVEDKFASRQHLVIQLQRTHFYLIDQSINGTLVTFNTGIEVHVLRRELFLGESGQISLGRRLKANLDHAVIFKHDRRSLYRT